jgi:nucleotide-binding universal stress UspA family protein
MQPQILVAYDFSSASERALAWAADLQRTLRGKPLQVIYVANPLPTVAAPETASISILSPEDVAALEASLAAAVHNVTSIATTQVIVSGSPGAAILETARKLHADMIVAGTHGRSALSRFFVGSVAEYVLRHANVPVVTVREPHQAPSHLAVAGEGDAPKPEAAQGLRESPVRPAPALRGPRLAP